MPLSNINLAEAVMEEEVDVEQEVTEDEAVVI